MLSKLVTDLPIQVFPSHGISLASVLLQYPGLLTQAEAANYDQGVCMDHYDILYPNCWLVELEVLFECPSRAASENLSVWYFQGEVGETCLTG
jgi:hypothetical protein